MSLFVQSWKGQASLAKAFWLVYVVIGLVIGIIVGILVYKMSHASPEYQQNLSRAIMFPYTLFASICVWRCGKNSMMLWNILAKIIVVLGILGGLYSIFEIL